MGLTYSPAPGYGSFVAGLAASAGQAIAARKAAEIAQQLKARREELLMQQQFQRDMKAMDYQMELEMQARSKQWDIEKMEIASRLDFEQDEKKRRAKQQEFETKKSAIMKSDMITPQQKSQLITSLELESVGAETTAAAFLRPLTPEQEIAQQMRDKTAGTVYTPESPVTQPGNYLLIKQEGQPLQYTDTTSGVVSNIDPYKQYKVTKLDGTSGIVLGANLEENIREVAEFHGEAEITQLPKAQQELIKKFSGMESIVSYPPDVVDPSEVSQYKPTSQLIGNRKVYSAVKILNNMEKMWKESIDNKQRFSKEWVEGTYDTLNKLSKLPDANKDQINRIINLIQQATIIQK